MKNFLNKFNDSNKTNEITLNINTIMELETFMSIIQFSREKIYDSIRELLNLKSINTNNIIGKYSPSVAEDFDNYINIYNLVSELDYAVGNIYLDISNESEFADDNIDIKIEDIALIKALKENSKLYLEKLFSVDVSSKDKDFQKKAMEITYVNQILYKLNKINIQEENDINLYEEE